MSLQLLKKLFSLPSTEAETVLSIDVLEDRMLLSSVVQTGYQDDFSFGQPDSGWQYLWNAPSDWTGNSSENAIDQRFGDPDHYVELQADGRSYRPTGEDAVDLSEPNRNLRISRTGGRVGAGFQQNESNNRTTRYAIAAWTVEEDGYHAIRDSTFSTHIDSKGIDIIIHVNDDDPVFRRRLSGIDKSFDTNLGFLEAGDVVYIGFGGGADDQGGTFRHDFDIVTLQDPGFTVLQSDGLTNVSEPGTTDSFSVVLNKRPETSQRIVVDISVGDSSELRTDRIRLSFNRVNWNIAQTVNVSGVNDSLDDGTSFTPITVSIDETRTNPEFLSVADHTFIAANFDDESPVGFTSQIASGVLRGLNEIVVVPGEYELSAANENAAHSYISWAEDVSIIADDVTVLANDLNTGILLRESSNVSLQGLSLDYVNLPFTQGTVTNVASDGSWLDVLIHAGYDLPSDGDSTRAIVHDSQSLQVKPFTASRFDSTVTALGGRRFRVNSFAVNDALTTGDFVSLTLPINTPHAIWVQSSENVRLDDITVNASTSFAFFETQGSGNEYYNLKVTPGDRPEGANFDRLLSSNYDGFHSKSAAVGPKIIGSHFSGTGDDGVAINGDYALVARNDGDSIVIASKWQLSQFEVGDQIRVYSEVTGVVSEATITDVERYVGNDLNFPAIRDQWLPDLRQTETQFLEGYRLTLSNSLPSTVGDLVSNIDRSGADYEIRDTVVENTRARGFVLKAPGGIVEGNRLDHIAFTGILLSPESQFWAEGDFSSNVTVRDNHISDAGFFFTNPGRRAGGGIALVADPQRDIRGHENVVIENNLLERIEGPSITLSNAVGVSIRENWIREPNENDHGFGQGSAIWIDNSSNILLEDNVIDRPGDFFDRPLTVTSNVSALNDTNAFIAFNEATTVVNQGVAYRGATGVNENEIDSSITALFDGEDSSASNISNFDRGINRVIVDLENFVRPELNLSDFDFRIGNSENPNDWLVLDDSSGLLPSVSTIAGPSSNLTRAVLDFADDSIRNTWLQVTVKANGNTGLDSDHTFYFGNLIGNAIDGNLSPGDQAYVNRADTNRILANAGNTTAATERFDIDRNGSVDGFDAAISRLNFSSVGDGLRIFAAPVLEPVNRLQIQFADSPENIEPLVHPNLLSLAQKVYIRDRLEQFDSDLPNNLSNTQRNQRVSLLQLDLAERHTNFATQLEARGQLFSAEYWSTIALAEREIANEIASQPLASIADINARWTS